MSKDGMPKDVALMHIHVTLKVGVICRSISICFESKICLKNTDLYTSNQ